MLFRQYLFFLAVAFLLNALLWPYHVLFMEQISGQLYSPLLLRILVYTSVSALAAGLLLVVWRKLPCRERLEVAKLPMALLLIGCLGVILPSVSLIINDIQINNLPNVTTEYLGVYIMPDEPGFWNSVRILLREMRVLQWLLPISIVVTIFHSLWLAWWQCWHPAK